MKLALDLQRMLIEDDIDAELEHDIRDNIEGVSVRFAPEMVVHIPFDNKNMIMFVHDENGYIGDVIYGSIKGSEPSQEENELAIKRAHKYIVSIADSIRKR